MKTKTKTILISICWSAVLWALAYLIVNLGCLIFSGNDTSVYETYTKINPLVWFGLFAGFTFIVYLFERRD